MRTEIYGFNTYGFAYLLETIEDHSTGAPLIWLNLYQKYTIEPNTKEIGNLSNGVALKQTKFELKELYRILNENELSYIERVILISTLNRVVVFKPDFEQLISVFNSGDPKTSLKQQAGIISKHRSDPNLIAIGWNPLNADENWLNFGGYDETLNDYRRYNVLTMKEHFDLFENF